MSKNAKDFQHQLQKLQLDFVHDLQVKNASPSNLGSQISSAQVHEAQQRFEVYRNNYTRGHLRALRRTYPASAAIIGADLFTQIGTEYLLAQRKIDSDIRIFGRHFPEFFAKFGTPKKENTWPDFLPDLVNLEWAIVAVDLSEDMDQLDTHNISDLGQWNLNQLTFISPPNLALIRSRFPIHLIWEAYSHRSPITTEMCLEALKPNCLVISRTITTPTKLSLVSEEIWDILDQVQKGHCFSQLVEANNNNAVKVQTLLAAAVGAGWITGLQAIFEPS